MNLPKACLYVALAPLFLVTYAMGAWVTWGSATTVDPNDPTQISLSGTLVTAVAFSASAGFGVGIPQTVNPVTFGPLQLTGLASGQVHQI